MKRHSARGVSTIEFAFSLLVLVPLFLGTGVTGINMIRTLQTVQLARDAGHMYARGVDFSQTGNQTILVNLGSALGLSGTAGQGSAVVILSDDIRGRQYVRGRRRRHQWCAQWHLHQL